MSSLQNMALWNSLLYGAWCCLSHYNIFSVRMSIWNRSLPHFQNKSQFSGVIAFIFIVWIQNWKLSVFFFLVTPCALQGLDSPASGQDWASGVGVLNPRHWTARKFLAPGNINWWQLSPKSPSWLQDPDPLNCLKAPVLDASSQATSKTGHKLTHQHTGCLSHTKISDTPKHTTICDSAHQSNKIQLHPPEGRHQSLLPGSLHKPLDQFHPLDQLHPLEADTRSKRNNALKPAENSPQTE